MLSLLRQSVEETVKARKPAKAPAYIRAEAAASDKLIPIETIDSIFSELSAEQQLQLSLKLGWIYADIDLISRESSSTPHHVLHQESGENGKKVRMDESDLFRLFQFPNPYMSKPFLLRMLIYWLNISDRGAFIFVAPDKNDITKPEELWPIPSTRIEPVKSPDNYITHYEYTTGGTYTNPQKKVLRILASHVIWLRYPDPFDLWKSLPPLLFALRAAQNYEKIVEAESKLFGNARGVPLSIVSVDPEINNTDFEIVREQIKHDWQDGTNVAVTKAGTINVASVGFNQKDLEAISSKISSRDEIDSIFFGFPLRTEKLVSGEGLKEVDRFIKEKTIWPLLDLIANDLTLQLAHRFYDPNDEIKFQDIRTADRALTIQEKIVDGRYRTVNEMRERDGESPFENPDFPDYGLLPVQLANNPSFIDIYYGLSAKTQLELADAQAQNSPGGVDRGRIENPQDIGNLPGLQDPERMASTSDQSAKSAQLTAIKAELAQMKKVLKKSPDRLFEREFVPDELNEQIVNSDDPIGEITKFMELVDGIKRNFNWI